MIKFITKLIKGDRPEETAITLEVEVLPLSIKEIFDNAVKAQVSKDIEHQLELAISELCYTEEELKDTEAAILKYHVEGMRTLINREQKVQCLLDYPQAIIISPRYQDGLHEIRLGFNYNRFLARLTEQVVEVADD